MDCLAFILGLSVPLSGLLVLMLRRAATLQPGLTAAMAGLAAAAAAATLLALVHPFDASAVDLAVHVGAVLAVVAVNRALGGRLLGDDASAAGHRVSAVLARPNGPDGVTAA